MIRSLAWGACAAAWRPVWRVRIIRAMSASVTFTARRHALRLAGLLLATGALPGVARAWNAKAAFEARNLADVVRAAGGGLPQESKDVVLTAPELYENGASVPLALSTTLPGVRQMLLVVDKNPSPLAARFEVSEAVAADFAVRVKMSESANVYAVAVMADGKAMFARREVRVTLGGCGA